MCQTVKEFLQNVTKAKIRDRYGTTEVCSNGMHVELSSYNRTVTSVYNLPPISKISLCQSCGLYSLLLCLCLHVRNW